MTVEALMALPENGGYDIVTDPATGHTERIRRPVQFLVQDADVCFIVHDGYYWIVGRGIDGTLYRERWNL